MNILKGSEGIALFVAILVMTITMILLGATLFLSRVDTKISSNLKFGTQALEVADAGLQHAMTLIAKGYDFDNVLNCGTPPCSLISTTTFPLNSEFTYSVTVEDDPNDPNQSVVIDGNNLVVLVSTANGPNNTKRQIQAYVNRSLVGFTPPGSFYFPASSANINFGPVTETSFLITGDDTDYDGTPLANPSPSITGAAPIITAVGDGFKTALASSRYNLAQGKDYDGATSPITPSVFTTTDQIDVNQIALNFFNNVSTVKDLDGEHKTCSQASPCVYGTDASPQITYIRELEGVGGNHIHLDGYVTGSGVLVTEGETHFSGNFDFHGLVIATKLGLTGGTPPESIDSDYFRIKGNAKVFGGILLGPTNSSQGFNVRENARIYYSSKGIDLANSLCGSCLPQPPRVFAWFDK